VTGVADAPGAARPSAAGGGARIAVVTGAAGGIGAAVCRRLARDGFVIACLDSGTYLQGAVLMVDGGVTA
jgi:hypothetical protein